ncbi:hypothetical protein AOLI_G00216590 [Acnodon oligacanthus]
MLLQGMRSEKMKSSKGTTHPTGRSSSTLRHASPHKALLSQFRSVSNLASEVASFFRFTGNCDYDARLRHSMARQSSVHILIAQASRYGAFLARRQTYVGRICVTTFFRFTGNCDYDARLRHSMARQSSVHIPIAQASRYGAFLARRQTYVGRICVTTFFRFTGNCDYDARLRHSMARQSSVHIPIAQASRYGAFLARRQTYVGRICVTTFFRFTGNCDYDARLRHSMARQSSVHIPIAQASRYGAFLARRQTYVGRICVTILRQDGRVDTIHGLADGRKLLNYAFGLL